AALAFLGSIDFNVGEFLRNFLFHSRMNFHPKLGMELILLGIAIALCALSARLRLTSIALGITSISFIMSPGRGWEPLSLLCVTVIAALETVFSEKPRYAAVLRSALGVSLFIIALPSLGYALHYLLDHPNPNQDFVEDSKALASTYESLGKSIAMDALVARKYFDFRIPDRAVDWAFGKAIADVNGYKLRDISEEGINGIWILDSSVLQNYCGDVDLLGFGDIRLAALNTRKEATTGLRWWRVRLFEKGFPWWRARVFELLPARFMNMIFLGQNFIRFSPLGGSEDPVLIDVESRKLYRGNQLIFEGTRPRRDEKVPIINEDC